MDHRNGREPDQSHVDSRVLGLAVEYECNDNVNDNISKEKTLELAKTSNGTSQEKETRKNKGLGIGKWRDPIHKSTIQTRRASHQVALKAERQRSSQQRLEQVDSTQQERDTRHNLMDQQACPEPTTALHEVKQMDNGPDRCVELRMVSKIDQREPIEITMYCLNKSKGSNEIAPLVDKIFKLAEQYYWIIEASHIPGLLNNISDSLSRLSRCGDYAFKNEVLQKTLKEHGIQISIDILVTRANRQCTRCCCISKDKCSIKRNKFNLEWAKEIPVLHQPISQLLKTKRKINQERVSLAILIASEQPNQKWYTELREITRQKICLGESTQCEQVRIEAFQTIVISQRTEFQSSRPSHFQLSSQRRTHIAGLRLLAGYLKKISQQPEYLLNLEQPQNFMANYLEDAINQKCSDNSVKNQRCALAVFLKFMGYPEQQIQSDLVKQLMRKIRMRLRQTDREKQIQDLDILLNNIKQQVPSLEHNLLSIQQRRAIAATLAMVFTVARLAELH
ncbi:MAG: hypothetical protein EZS28_011377 [Streblomastix strix]|uniref:Uncharacterized protein n=1 Tax=Streblomastix strix TaxID=222440 RepID=A0A5J4WDX9_9EUKA|nr:MAG: hypothetical protein EZS28_011377 [Streblomastix strix]